MKNVRIVSEGPTGQGCRVENDKGESLHGVRSLTIAMHPDNPTLATLELIGAMVNVTADQAIAYMNDPGTGVRKRIARIEFSDGSVFE